MDAIEALTRDIIERERLEDWLAEFPWLTGHLGDPNAPIWFVAENPSRTPVERVDRLSGARTPNRQWSCYAGPEGRLLREALGGAGLKTGDPCGEGGWRCYITNADKEPHRVGGRNSEKDAEFMRRQAIRWQPELQAEIDRGSPKLLVAFGNQALKLLRYMVANGLRAPLIEKIHHYSYIVKRPERSSGRGPNHPDRVREFKQSIAGFSVTKVCTASIPSASISFRISGS